MLDLPHVDAGNGRLIFAAPPTELAVHAHEGDAQYELWLVCDDIVATVAELEKKGITTTPIADRGWGLVTTLDVPRGDRLALYEPKHLSPLRDS